MSTNSIRQFCHDFLKQRIVSSKYVERNPLKANGADRHPLTGSQIRAAEAAAAGVVMDVDVE